MLSITFKLIESDYYAINERRLVLSNLYIGKSSTILLKIIEINL